MQEVDAQVVKELESHMGMVSLAAERLITAGSSTACIQGKGWEAREEVGFSEPRNQSHMAEAEVKTHLSGIWALEGLVVATDPKIGRKGKKYSGFSFPPISQAQQEARSPRHLDTHTGAAMFGAEQGSEEWIGGQRTHSPPTIFVKFTVETLGHNFLKYF